MYERKDEHGKFKKQENKLGEPTKGQIEFSETIYNELAHLRKQQYKKILKHKDLDINEVYMFFKEKYKLVKLYINEEHYVSSFIIIRLDKSTAVVINHFDIRLLRFYEKDKLFTLAEMIDDYLNSNFNNSTSRMVGNHARGLGNKY